MCSCDQYKRVNMITNDGVDSSEQFQDSPATFCNVIAAYKKLWPLAIFPRRPEETICSKRSGVRSRGATAPRWPARFYANFHKNKSDSRWLNQSPLRVRDRLSILLLLAQSRKGTNYCFAICSRKNRQVYLGGISLWDTGFSWLSGFNQMF